MKSMDGLESVLSRGVDSIYPSRNLLLEKLRRQKLRIYNGIDPTSTSIHLGHSIILRKLAQFQKLGHKIILVFGDFTGMVGDPSGKDTQRKPLTRRQVLENSSSYKSLVGKILDFKKNPPEIFFNSNWWDKVKAPEILEMLSHFTVQQLLERDMFQERIEKRRPIAASEFLYPILQGYDSVAIDTDVEIGGTDQTFNMLVGREFMKIKEKKEKFVITIPLLEGTDGRKMSKSFGNTIDLNEEPNQMFGKIMSIKDDLIVKYFTLLTDVGLDEISKIEESLKNSTINPRDAKINLALEIVKIYHGESEAKNAQNEFERVFQEGGVPETKKVGSKTGKIKALDLIMNLEMASSRSEAKRLIEQGGVKSNGEKIVNPNQLIDVEIGTIVQIGKLKAVEIMRS
ncbi:MAG: tyrosine--tRNA ligase [Candidatus Woykebacteria bacterium RBG_13_40_15]|uniref:Tyrosine--tRNA ligase n=1 Tax=Candidatus Woykebacteria bacterium RBG_13_40_15 TaxID=1802593 RepID=A0A1G1W717_9BACT|nr:MAG: tyrosine--tRNA ligase [Candidatus Woykebacteria bacterium RBG_13_40_15]